jgi:hypothetical protein
MKKIFVMSISFVLLTGCVSTTSTVKDEKKSENKSGYPGRWEQAVLTQDDFGSELWVVRENEEVWVIASKTNCFWARQYVGRYVWFRWGPVESQLMSDNGDICEFWTKKRIQ